MEVCHPRLSGGRRLALGGEVVSGAWVAAEPPNPTMWLVILAPLIWTAIVLGSIYAAGAINEARRRSQARIAHMRAAAMAP